MRKYFLLLLLIYPAFSFGQTLTGVVFGNSENGKQTLPGVNIYWQGTSEGTVSQADGSFEIKKKSDQYKLVFSFVGYHEEVVHIEDFTPLSITLEPNLEIEEVVVTEKDRGSYLSVINPIQTIRIGGAELHKAACCNLAESFETNPSVDVSYSDALTGAKQIRLLGLEGTYSLLQVENIPNLRGLATTFGLTYIPGPWLESIQVSKGAASVLNGYESIAGQINAELKKPDSQEKLNLNVYANAHGQLEFNANTNIRVYKDMLTTGLLFHANDMKHRVDENSDGFLDDPLKRQIQLQNRWKYNNFKGFMMQAGINLLTEDRMGGQTDFKKEMERNTSAPYGININTDRIEGYFKTGYDFPNQRMSVAFLSNASHHETSSFYGLNDYEAYETRYYANLVFSLELDENERHLLNTGVSLISDKFNEKLYNVTGERTETVPGVFAEYTLKPSENLTFMAGMRVDFHNMFGTFVTPRMHFRYNLNEHITLRTSAGKGYRTANVIAENTFLLANTRQLKWQEYALPEEAWNYGVALVQRYSLLGRVLQVNAEFFRTDFQKQLLVDRETSTDYILLTPLAGKSFANSLQLDVSWQPVERLDLLLAYRINDVKQTIGGVLREKPLTSRYKGLINLNYSTNLKKWMFDYTIQFNGGGRIPYNLSELGSLREGESNQFAPYTVMNAQITRYFRYWNIYLGSENLANFKQKNPIRGADNPFGPLFSATNIWGPVIGRKIYMGIRFNLNYN
ncbi:MAG: TonB-dependent receptor [Draconibacterium sp.]|nr:MAG: TonB-dependent receptor [Draconibacterium sp.]